MHKTKLMLNSTLIIQTWKVWKHRVNKARARTSTQQRGREVEERSKVENYSV